MTTEINKLKVLYQQLDRQSAAGDDVVTELKKEINNLELAYLKEQVLPQVAQFMASKIRDLKCSFDCSFQFDGERSINYSFCTSGSMLFAKGTHDMSSVSNISEIIASQPQDISQPTIESKTNSVASKRLIRLVDYSEKAIALYGDTKDYKDELKNLGGYYNPRLRDGAGWIFSKKRIPALKKLLGSYLQNENVE